MSYLEIQPDLLNCLADDLIDDDDFDLSKIKYKHPVALPWRCKRGHVVVVRLANYARKGCAPCKREDRLEQQSLEATYPNLAAEWDSEKNGVLPNQVFPGQGGKKWWRCPDGHSYQSTLNNRKNKGTGCPTCRKISFDYLIDKHPILKDIYGDLNEFLIDEVGFVKMSDVFYWKCVKENSFNMHEYDMAIEKVITEGRKQGCPYCYGHRVKYGINDALTIKPWLTKFVKKEQVNSLKEMYHNDKSQHDWICSQDSSHYFTRNLFLAVEDTFCPLCVGREVLIGVNDLLSFAPWIVRVWSDLNDYGPEKYFYDSSKAVYFTCSLSHHFKRSIKKYVKGLNSCPICLNKMLLPGFNDLQTKFPELAAEWNAEKNGELTPQMVLYGARKSVWWNCPNGHKSFKQSIAGRTSRGDGCRTCSKVRRSSKIEMDFFASVNAMLGDKYDIVQHDTNQLDGKELDIWIPGSALGVEFNGDYWHSEHYFSIKKEQHDAKEKRCAEKGITLMVVWERQWTANPEKVLNDLEKALFDNHVPSCYTYAWGRENIAPQEAKERGLM